MSYAGKQGFAEDYGIILNLTDQVKVMKIIGHGESVRRRQKCGGLNSKTQSIDIKVRKYERTYTVEHAIWVAYIG